MGNRNSNPTKGCPTAKIKQDYVDLANDDSVVTIRTEHYLLTFTKGQFKDLTTEVTIKIIINPHNPGLLKPQGWMDYFQSTLGNPRYGLHFCFNCSEKDYLKNYRKAKFPLYPNVANNFEVEKSYNKGFTAFYLKGKYRNFSVTIKENSLLALQPFDDRKSFVLTINNCDFHLIMKIVFLGYDQQDGFENNVGPNYLIDSCYLGSRHFDKIEFTSDRFSFSQLNE